MTDPKESKGVDLPKEHCFAMASNLAIACHFQRKNIEFSLRRFESLCRSFSEFLSLSLRMAVNDEDIRVHPLTDMLREGNEKKHQSI